LVALHQKKRNGKVYSLLDYPISEGQGIKA